MKKSGLVCSVTLAFSLLECLLLPFIIVATIFGVPYGSIVLVILELAVLCGTAITANIAGGYNPKTRWYTVVLPPITFICAWLGILEYDISSIADWWVVLVAGIVLLCMCLTAFLLSRRRQKIKRNKALNETV